MIANVHAAWLFLTCTPEGHWWQTQEKSPSKPTNGHIRVSYRSVDDSQAAGSLKCPGQHGRWLTKAAPRSSTPSHFCFLYPLHPPRPRTAGVEEVGARSWVNTFRRECSQSLALTIDPAVSATHSHLETQYPEDHHNCTTQVLGAFMDGRS